MEATSYSKTLPPGLGLYTMSDVIKSWCKVTHLVALATIAIVDGTRAGLPAQGCNCCTGGVLSCQQGKRGACAGWEF